MSQITYWGTDGQVQAGIYGGVAPTTYEEGGTNGFGQRMTPVRMYYNQPSAAFQSGDKAFFDTGHLLVVSVSNQVAAGVPWYTNITSGTYDTPYGNMFTTVAGWDFGAAVTAQSRSITTTNSNVNIGGTFTGADVNATITGTGIQSGTTIVSQTGTAAVMSKTATATGSPTASITQGVKAPYVYFIWDHEFDQAKSPRNTYGTAAQFAAAHQYLHNLCNTKLVAAGVPTSRVRWCWNATQTGFDVGRVDAFYPGNAYVDVIGTDPYVTSSGKSFSALIATALTYARSKGKPLCIPEIANIATDSVAAQNWYIDMGNQIANSDVTFEFVCSWIGNTGNEPSNYSQYNFNKLGGASADGAANPLKHSGLATALATMGNNPIFTSVGIAQGLPSAPTGFAATSNAAGTALTMTWAANPGGDNVSGWDTYINPGVTTNLHKDNPSALAASPLSHTFAGLTPGTQYSLTAVAINSAGRSGYGTIIQATTSTPGATNHAPVIDSASMTPVAGTFGANYSVTAHDPDSNPIVYAWTVTDAHGVTQTSTAASGSFNFPQVGTYTWSVTVTDNGTPPLSTTQTGSFAITTNQVPNTTNYNWPVPLTGTDVRTLAPLLRGVLPDLDDKLWTTSTRPSAHNAIHGYVASTMDPATLAGSTNIQLTTNQLYWAAMVLQGSQINGITTLIATSQSGTGSVVALYNSAGHPLLNDDGTSAVFSGTAVDTWLQAAAGPSDYTLTNPITTRLDFGQIIYIGVFNPTQATHAAIRASASAAFVSSRNASTQYRAAVVGSQSTCPDPLPFASQATAGNQNLAFYALF
jgi:hypothetical protein